MALPNKPLESINERDLNDLIENQIREDKTIEFKSAFPGNSDKDKKEFLADISSFANTSGGDLIFGIETQQGVASRLVGFSESAIDGEILRLDNLLRDGIDPRVPNIKMRPIPFQTAAALIVRVPRSWIPPHRVKYAGSAKFYARNSAGKYELDVSELRPLFALSATAAENIRRFRVERLAKIVSGEISTPLRGPHRLVLHVVPFGAFDPLSRFDLRVIKPETDRLRPMGVSGRWIGPRHNFDGLLSFALCDRTCFSYIQLFRNGSIEMANTSLLANIERTDRSPERYIYDHYETEVANAIVNSISIQKELGVEPPLFVMLSFLGVKDYVVAFSGSYSPGEGHPIDQNDLLIPEELIESFDSDIQEVTQRIYDIVWNAAGFSAPPQRQGRG